MRNGKTCFIEEDIDGQSWYIRSDPGSSRIIDILSTLFVEKRSDGKFNLLSTRGGAYLKEWQDNIEVCQCHKEHGARCFFIERDGIQRVIKRDGSFYPRNFNGKTFHPFGIPGRYEFIRKNVKLNVFDILEEKFVFDSWLCDIWVLDPNMSQFIRLYKKIMLVLYEVSKQGGVLNLSDEAISIISKGAFLVRNDLGKYCVLRHNGKPIFDPIHLDGESLKNLKLKEFNYFWD